LEGTFQGGACPRAHDGATHPWLVYKWPMKGKEEECNRSIGSVGEMRRTFQDVWSLFADAGQTSAATYIYASDISPERTTRTAMTTTLKQVLTIAGSDSGGGAGIQADIKAMSANGVFAMSVITAITAQNTEEVTDVFELPPSVIAAQIDAVFDDFEVAAVKTGMLSSATIVETVAKMLKPQEVVNLVVDPVMISKSGHTLLKPDAIEAVKKQLFPLALLVTPNVHEAQQLSGIRITSLAEARRAAKVIHGFGCQHVLIKGGHLIAERATDLLYDGRFFHVYKGEFIETPHTHGTGCTYASAIAAHLARGSSVVDAVQSAKTYVTEAIRHSLAIGHGSGPTNHFYFLAER
jgi:hydroxymethylpyrimidine/phosphomethylpyrimidine kinase